MIFGLFDPLYLLFMLPALLISIVAQAQVGSAMSQYSRILASSGMTGAEVARRILALYGIGGVEVGVAQGFLSDHYDPVRRRLMLSPGVYNGTSIAALGVAAHEAGHALQHAEGYFPLSVRSALVPATKIGSLFSWPLLFFGLIFSLASLVKLGIILFSLVVLFQLVTLPVEFDASRRALAVLAGSGILTPVELDGARKVLRAAAMTYVAAAATAILQLLYFLLRASAQDE